MKSEIPHSRPFLGAEETEAVADVIRSGHIAQGDCVAKFEKCFARLHKISRVAPHAVALSSGTAALHLALTALELREGDEVILPSFVCTALLNAIHYINAVPVFAEINPETSNIDPQDVEKKITGRTRAVIIPHMFGLPADMEKFSNLPKAGIPLIEDCAQAVGSTYQGRKAGTFSTISVFSFYATKVMTTGEGGMVLSGDEKLIRRIRDLKEYDGKNEYRLRYNCKMTDMQAAMGLVQLKRLESMIRRRRSIAAIYKEHLDCPEILLPPDDPGHIYFRYVIRLKKNAGPLIQAMGKKGIRCARPVHMPLHRCMHINGFQHTENIWKRSLSLPIYPALSDDAVCFIIRELKKAMGKLNF